MAVITAAMVGQLRAKTDAPMMECKKALTEANGDIQKAEDILRVKLGNKASKASSRIAAEGVIAIHVDGNAASIVEVNCETDFVTKMMISLHWPMHVPNWWRMTILPTWRRCLLCLWMERRWMNSARI